jgi:hypothetical protein
MNYTTNLGPLVGTIKYDELPLAIAIYGEAAELPIGMALGMGMDDRGHQLWTLALTGERLPGQFVIVDRHFVQADAE